MPYRRDEKSTLSVILSAQAAGAGVHRWRHTCHLL